MNVSKIRREIKFRAKGQTDNNWHYGLLSFKSDTHCKIKESSYRTYVCDKIKVDTN